MHVSTCEYGRVHLHAARGDMGHLARGCEATMQTDLKEIRLV